MNEPEQMKKPVYQSFVSPSIAKKLWEAGLKFNCPYIWKIKNGRAVLFTSLFDDDGYYQNAQEIIDKVSPIDEEYAGLQIGDVEKILPGFTIEKFQGNYSIMIDRTYDVHPASRDRFPDALAIMALMVMEKLGEPFIKSAIDILTK